MRWSHDSQFFHKGGLGIWENHTIDASHGTARMEEVQAKIHVLSFLTATDVLNVATHSSDWHQSNYKVKRSQN